MVNFLGMDRAPLRLIDFLAHWHCRCLWSCRIAWSCAAALAIAFAVAAGTGHEGLPLRLFRSLASWV